MQPARSLQQIGRLMIQLTGLSMEEGCYGAEHQFVWMPGVGVGLPLRSRIFLARVAGGSLGEPIHMDARVESANASSLQTNSLALSSDDVLRIVRAA
jgi:hypothetical protein